MQQRQWLLLFLSKSLILTNSGATEIPTVQSFVSRPDLLAPVLDVKKIDHSLVSPGYIFLSTWEGEAQSAPYIYDNQGKLVWSGYDPSLPNAEYFNFQARTLSNGSSVLSVFRGHSDSGRGEGHVALYDSSYRQFRTIESPSKRTSLDFHEFDLLDDGKTAIVVSLQPYQGDLSSFNVTDGVAWLLDSVFYTIDLESDKVSFEWRASDHIPIDESAVWPSTKIGAGLAYSHAFDWFHINSIDRFENGDCLLSARHTDTLYRLSGVDGSVLWRLGGKQSSIQLGGFRFSAQHDARIVEQSLDGTLRIVLYNNGFNGQNKTHETSSAMLIEVDEKTMTARLVQEMLPPTSGVAQNTGSIQYLAANGKAFVSWGQMKGWAGFTEFGPDGNIVLDVAFSDSNTRNYRVKKTEWVGHPSVQPDLYLYSRNSGSNTNFWMSWNGATEVFAWRMYEIRDQAEILLRVIEKDGFETHFEADRAVARAIVEAVDSGGKLLGRSGPCAVFIPPASLAQSCAESHCRKQILHAREKPGAVLHHPAAVSSLRVGEVLYAVFLVAIGFAIGKSRLLTSLLSRRHRVDLEMYKI